MNKKGNHKHPHPVPLPRGRGDASNTPDKSSDNTLRKKSKPSMQSGFGNSLSLEGEGWGEGDQNNQKLPNSPINIFLVSFLLSIFLLQFFQSPSYPLWLWQLLFFLLLHSLLLRSIRKLLIPGLLGISLALLSVARTTHIPSTSTIDSYAGQEMILIGTIIDEPDRRPLQTKYTIGIQGSMNPECHPERSRRTDIQNSCEFQSITGKLLYSDRRMWPEFAYGDRVVVEGKIQKPEPIEDFAYDKYLSRRNIYAVMTYGSLKSAPQTVTGNTYSRLRFGGLTNSIKSLLFSLKSSFEHQIALLFPEPSASFLAGLLTGSRRGIPNDLLEKFNITGLTHIIAISGYNITIVLAIISSLLWWIPLHLRIIPSTTAIVAFTLFVGADAAVVRACIMGILGLLALHTGRKSQTRLLILWTALFMLVWNPKYLWYDAGFQLSFLALIGITEFGHLIAPFAEKFPQVLGIREALHMTLAAQITVIPLLIFLFGRISLIAPLANILVAVAVPIAMLFGFLGTITSYIFFPLGQLIAYPGHLCLQWTVLVAEVLGSIPGAAVSIPGTWKIICSVIYIAFVLFVLFQKNLLRSMLRNHYVASYVTD